MGLNVVSVGHDFFETLGVEMLAGRTLSVERPSDSGAVVVNRAALDLLTRPLPVALTPETALDRRIMFSDTSAMLIGVAEEFNLSSLHEAAGPIVFHILPDWHSSILVRIAPGSIGRTLAAVEDAWEARFPQWPINYTFADEAFDAAYRAEERLGGIFTSFSMLAILIACLGLFGLVSYTAGQRRKEIGVRKVLGASVSSIMYLLSRDFALLVVIGLVFAAPAAYLAMSRWLDTFAYRIDIPALLFAVVGVAMFAIAVLTVSYQSMRAATADPVKSLRYE